MRQDRTLANSCSPKQKHTHTRHTPRAGQPGPGNDGEAQAGDFHDGLDGWTLSDWPAALPGTRGGLITKDERPSVFPLGSSLSLSSLSLFPLAAARFPTLPKGPQPPLPKPKPGHIWDRGSCATIRPPAFPPPCSVWTLTTPQTRRTRSTCSKLDWAWCSLSLSGASADSAMTQRRCTNSVTPPPSFSCRPPPTHTPPILPARYRLETRRGKWAEGRSRNSTAPGESRVCSESVISGPDSTKKKKDTRGPPLPLAPGCPELAKRSLHELFLAAGVLARKCVSVVLVASLFARSRPCGPWLPAPPPRCSSCLGCWGKTAGNGLMDAGWVEVVNVEMMR